MAHQTFALNLARSMIADQGVAIIWRLHVEATVLWRMGNRAAAEAFVEIADAAELKWLRCRETEASTADLAQFATRYSEIRLAGGSQL